MIEFKLPSLGADMDEGTLLEWKVRPGDEVTKGQVIAVVDTAKAAIDVECWTPGIVHELIVEVGQKMPVGTVMAQLLEAGAAPPGPTTAPRRKISPAAKKRAAVKGIELDRIVGTGPHGAVTLEDVEKAAAVAKPVATVDKTQEMRKAIAAAMARSKREIPHYYVAEEIQLEKALAWLGAENTRRPIAERLLPAALLLKAIATTLKRYPELNGHFRDGTFMPAERINLGVAISLRQGGLIAPALLDASTISLTQLMQGLTDLVKRTRAGSLRSSELIDGTITVTNLGDQGAQSVFGVIYPPQVALVGLGRIIERPCVDADGGIKAMPVIVASLAADHRVSDGHRGALFLRELAELLQHPEELDK